MFEQAYGYTFPFPSGYIHLIRGLCRLTLPAYLRKLKKITHQLFLLKIFANPRLVKQIAREAGLNVAGVLYTDALSEPGGPASTYLAMMEHNVTAIATAASNSRNTQP